jgi:hypothetical protein
MMHAGWYSQYRISHTDTAMLRRSLSQQLEVPTVGAMEVCDVLLQE